MPQVRKKQSLTNVFLIPEEGKVGYAAYERALEVRGGPKRAMIGGKEMVLRKYHLSRRKLDAVLAKWRASGRFVSPFSKGVTTDFLTALATLGVNQVWHTGKIATAMKGLMHTSARVRDGKTDWERYRDKRSKAKKSQTLPARIETLARDLRKTLDAGSLFPEGRRLEQIGCCVDIFIWDHKELRPHEDPAKAEAGEKQLVNVHDTYYRLNTHSTRGKIIRIDDPSELENFPVNVRSKSFGPE